MGLDMYAYTVKEDVIGDDQVDIALSDAFTTYIKKHPELLDSPVNLEEVHLADLAEVLKLYDRGFAYWRKFNALHGWMEELYRKKGGVDPDFNCNVMRLTLEDLTQLEEDIDSLSPIEGFFFGSTDPVDDDDKEEVRTFIRRSRKAIEDGHAVLYYSWW